MNYIKFQQRPLLCALEIFSLMTFKAFYDQINFTYMTVTHISYLFSPFNPDV